MAINPSKLHDSLRQEYDFSIESIQADSGPRGIIYRSIPSHSYVLDIGCDTGKFGEILTLEKQCIVDGIEPWQPAAEQAAQRLRYVSVQSIESWQSFASFKNYNVVLFLCVLEHLYDPWSALKGAYSVLNPGGTIYVLVPNIAHLSIIRRLLCGQFEYTDYGTMDRTHLRWFTRKSLGYMLENSGFGNIHIQMIPLVPYLGNLGNQKSWVEFLSNQACRFFPDLLGGSILAKAIK